MIRILTDSASDILPAEAEQLGVTVIPLNVTLEDGTVLRDGVDMTPSAYYEILAGCRKLPTTSQPSPELFENFFLEAVAAGDEVIGIFLSHALSGTYQCAKLAADMANVDNVLFVDSGHVCLSEALLVRLAVQLRDSGKTAGQIAAILEHAKEHLHLVAAIDDLKYLRKGGRLPAAVAVAGGRLGIKPLITIQDGKVAMAGNPSAADPNDPTARASRMMMWMMPIMSLWIGFTLPASLGVYWIANSVLMLVQEKVLNKYFKKSMAAEDEAREKARMEDRLRRMEEARVAQQQREAEKKSLKEKQKAAQAAKAAKAEKAKKATTENGRIGDRPYARGRSFNADHYGE